MTKVKKTITKKNDEKIKMKPVGVILVIVALTLIGVGIGFEIYRINAGAEGDTNELGCLEPDPGYVDCMPPLNENEAARCKLAKECGWKIAY